LTYKKLGRGNVCIIELDAHGVCQLGNICTEERTGLGRVEGIEIGYSVSSNKRGDPKAEKDGRLQGGKFQLLRHGRDEDVNYVSVPGRIWTMPAI